MTPLEEQWPTETPERAVMDAFSAFRGRDVARLAALTDAPATSVLDDLMTRLPEVFTDSVRCFVMGHVDVAYVVFRPGFELPGQGVVPLPSELQIATTRRVDGEWKLVLDEESDVRLPGFRGVGFWVDEKASHLDRESRRQLLVSHDRAFLREAATRVWSFDGTHLRDFDGSFVEWEEDRKRRVGQTQYRSPLFAPFAIFTHRAQAAEMICRIWHGWTTHANADVYERLLRDEVFVGIHGRDIAGFHGVELLRRPLEGDVEFSTMMWFDSLDAVRQFAGEDYELAMVPQTARTVLSHFDARSAHYDARIAREDSPISP